MFKLYNIQGLRAIAVLLVLFSHLFRIEEKYSSDQLLPNIMLSGISGVDLFFVISGFIMVTVTRGKFQSVANAGKFIYQRASRIYPLYWVFTTAVLAVAIIKPSWVNSGLEVSTLYSYLLLPQDSAPLLAVGWTLIHEMYFYIIFLIIMLFPERYLFLCLSVWAISIVLLHVLVNSSNPAIELIRSPLTYEFIGGAVVAIIHNSKKKVLRLKHFFIPAILCFLLMTIGHELYIEKFDVQPTGWWRLLIFGTPSLAIVYIFVEAEKAGLVFPRWLTHIGDASYSIYLSHVLALSALGRIWFMFASEGFLDNIIALPIIVLLTLIVGSISYCTAEKFMLRVSRRAPSFMNACLKSAIGKGQS